MSSRYNPFEELERVFTRMSQQLSEASRGWDDPGTLTRLPRREETLSLDLVDDGDSYVATVDLPGFEKDDVSITIHNSTLQIDADGEEMTDKSTEQFLHKERMSRSLSRSVHLPALVDEEAVSAKMNNGVLTITLPKVETAETKTVEISVE